VTFFAYDTIDKISLFISDWDVVQIEDAMLETWLPTVFRRRRRLPLRAAAVKALIRIGASA
jgi:hypothetical protein